MARLHPLEDSAVRTVLAFHCPGCRCAHAVPVRGDGTPFARGGKLWSWNGSLDMPTFRPSLHYQQPGSRCHSWVTAGRIQFLADSDHALAGQTVDVPDWDD